VTDQAAQVESRHKLALFIGPVGETYSAPSGAGRSPFQDNAATIYTNANTGAMLSVGQKCSREIEALAAGPGCD
jgi:hypothetical protein